MAASSYENYLYYYEHEIKNDPIGAMKVIDIRKSDLLLYFSKKSAVNKLKNGTIHILNKIIHPALQLAVDDDIIRKNPVDGCMKEYKQESEIKYALSPEEEQEFLERILLRPRMRHLYPFFAIMLCTGMRIGEAIGLTWDDVDKENRTIRINHQLQYRRINGEMKLYCIDEKKGKADTKTQSGKRILPMNQQVYELFCEQQKEWLKIKKDPDFEIDGYKNFVFLSNRTGRNLYPPNIRKTLNRIVAMNDERAIKLPHISPHILRHTTCTRYAESGMDIKTNQYLMGHSDIKTTIKVYNHVDLERARRELERYDSWKDSYTDIYTNFYTKLV